MFDIDEDEDLIDEDFGKFPLHMNLVRDVFAFSHEEAGRVTMRFQNNVDLFSAFDQAIYHIKNSDLPRELKDIASKLIEEEKDIINFSIVAKSSVVAM